MNIQQLAKHLIAGGQIVRKFCNNPVKRDGDRLIRLVPLPPLNYEVVYQFDEILADDWEIYPEETTDLRQALEWVSNGFRVGMDSIPAAGYLWMDLQRMRICAIRDASDVSNDSPDPAHMLFCASKFTKLDKQ